MNTTSLKALAEGKTEGVQKATYFKVDPCLILFEPGFNLREEGPELDEHIAQLKRAMLAGAYIPPIDVSVVDGRIFARDGHCRTRAAVQIIDAGNTYMLEARQVRGNEADSVFHMLGSGAGRHFTPLEQGKGFARLRAYGLGSAQIAERLGLSRTTVENGLALAEMPVAAQKLVGEGKVASHLALKTVRRHGAKAGEVLQEAVNSAVTAGKKKATEKYLAVLGTDGLMHAKPNDALTNDLFTLVQRLAAVNIIVSNLDRAAVAGLVQDARKLVGGA